MHFSAKPVEKNSVLSQHDRSLDVFRLSRIQPNLFNYSSRPSNANELFGRFSPDRARPENELIYLIRIEGPRINNTDSARLGSLIADRIGQSGGLALSAKVELIAPKKPEINCSLGSLWRQLDAECRRSEDFVKVKAKRLGKWACPGKSPGRVGPRGRAPEFRLDKLRNTTFLGKTRDPKEHNSLRRQLEKSVHKLECQIEIGEEDYHRQFMKMFKMQLELRQADFGRLRLFYRVRFLSLFFYNFVDKRMVHRFYGDFWPGVQILERPEGTQSA